MTPPAAGTQFAVAGGVTDARVAAAEVLADLRRGEMLDSSFERRAASLDSRDRRWTQELVYGMLRRRSWIDAVLGDRVRGGLARLDPDLIDLLRLGVHQLIRMHSVPPYAAIAQTVELAKRRHGIGASKLANAVLRRTDRERDILGVRKSDDEVETLAAEYSHPRWIVARWLARYGSDETIRLLTANNIEPPLIVRPFGVVREQLEATLESAGVHVSDAPLVRDSLIVRGHVSLAELGAFRQGLFFVQDPASTLVAHYAAIEPGSVVADLCAAPGGKALELARTAGAVLASDRSLARLQKVVGNSLRVETQTIIPYVSDARHPAIRPVDVVLIDVPCTGTGTFRRHPDARWRLRVSDLAVTTTLQRSILRSAAGVVRPGGLLVYSTCSLEPEENDDQIAVFLAENREFVLEPPPAESVPVETLDGGVLRVLPQRHGTDGAYAARLRRTN
ncbi:MAG TPA: 16S rRNA (cytosine(967)-C(5))-methyltransferase RsmB [Gemmatimonadaceae bacterium]|nr:16S rRNA (cytosine(967)-C(5))-methyltransferase RsmB [Gemmatimonadaceae bacterium]